MTLAQSAHACKCVSPATACDLHTRARPPTNAFYCPDFHLSSHARFQRHATSSAARFRRRLCVCVPLALQKRSFYATESVDTLSPPQTNTALELSHTRTSRARLKRPTTPRIDASETPVCTTKHHARDGREIIAVATSILYYSRALFPFDKFVPKGIDALIERHRYTH